MIMGILELLGVRLPLFPSIVGLGAELVPKVSSGHRLRPVSLDPRQIPVTPGLGAGVVASSTMMLDILENLLFQHTLGFLGLGAELAPKVCCLGHWLQS